MIIRNVLVFVFATLIFSGSALSEQYSENDPPEATVAKLYRDFAWEAVMAVPAWEGLIDQPKNILEQYFDDRLTSLILKDRACAKKHGVCNLNFLPIWASQDPGATDLKVEKLSKADLVLATFRYPSTNKEIKLQYHMNRTSRGWRIGNITGPDWSLLAILESSK